MRYVQRVVSERRQALGPRTEARLGRSIQHPCAQHGHVRHYHRTNQQGASRAARTLRSAVKRFVAVDVASFQLCTSPDEDVDHLMVALACGQVERAVLCARLDT